MGDRFRLVGVTVHDGGAELRLACSQEDAYRWSFKGDRFVELSEVTESETDTAGSSLPSSPHSAEDGWRRVDEEIGTDEDDVFLDVGDWFWSDDHGRVRRAYGLFGNSTLAVHTFDADGKMLVAIEARDEVGKADLDDPTGRYPAVRKLADDLPITRAEAAAKWPGVGWEVADG